MSIYMRTGRDIYQKRQKLRAFSIIPRHPDDADDKASIPVDSKTTDVQITIPPCSHPPSPLYSHHSSRDYPLHSINISSSSTRPTPNPSSHTHTNSPPYNTDIAAWAYTKVALLFFAALLITWIPSTVNRVYTLARSGAVSFPLTYVEALVLPLQGFWNALIYIATSMSACRALWRRGRKGNKRKSYIWVDERGH
ncbi:hypothetical protein MMC08_006531 [Hypocenomyce scalaris]|nr:hypothetical protein [Hypocenomyce scalaris]